jgi:DNA-binding HxlR family transcriptional regulator
MEPRSPGTVTSASGAAEPDCVSAGCEIGDLFRLLGKSHVMRILYLFLKEDPRPHRFVDVQKRLSLSPNTLTERLKELVEAGLLTRTAFNEIPPRVDYAATQKARDLDSVFVALLEWSRAHDLAPPTSPRAATA